MRIGDLAKATGLSVRALRHYDEIGLLKPTTRTDQREYSLDDLERLQKIVYLKQLGLSLDEIRAQLDRPSLQIIDERLALLERQLSELTQALQGLRASRALIATGRALTTDELIKNLKEATMFEKYYTLEQLEDLKARANPQAMEDAGRKWKDLIEKVRAAVDDGVSPTSDEARSMAREWMALVAAFSGGDQAIEANTMKMYRENPQATANYGLNQDLFAFISQASKS